MADHTENSNVLLGSLLKEVSRSFYLTLRVLPRSVRPQIGLAYLLARTSDTIADTDLIPVEQRLAALQNFRARLSGTDTAPFSLLELAQKQGASAERTLLEEIDAALDLLDKQSAADQALIRSVVNTIISGQELDLKRFAGGNSKNILPLQTAHELDDYTYRVAGCVGEFWTRICRLHVYSEVPLDDAFLLTNGVRFGKGLQLVNILRDLPADLRNGRCYLPAEELARHGLTPTDLLNREVEPRLRPVYNAWLNRAEADLRAGWAYTNALPRKNMRVRLACAWPILLGLETIRLLRFEKIIEPTHRVKTGRGFVRKMIFRSLVLYPFPQKWTALAGARAETGMQASEY
jgi:farnesyl-diphosphate farnesyltransferase